MQQQQQRGKAQPASSASGAASPGSSQVASHLPQPFVAAASAPVSPHAGAGPDARESLEVQRPSDVRWLRAVSSMPSSPAAAMPGRWGLQSSCASLHVFHLA